MEAWKDEATHLTGWRARRFWLAANRTARKRLRCEPPRACYGDGAIRGGGVASREGDSRCRRCAMHRANAGGEG